VFQWTYRAHLSLDCVVGLATGHISTVTSRHHTTPAVIHVSYQLLLTLQCFVSVNSFKGTVTCHNQKFILGVFSPVLSVPFLFSFPFFSVSLPLYFPSLEVAP